MAEVLGCRTVAEYDVGVAGLHRLHEAMDRIGPEADVLIVNTCSIRDKAEQKLLDAGFDRDLLDEAVRILGEATVCAIAQNLEEKDAEKVVKELQTEIQRDRTALNRGSRYLRASASRIEELLAEDGFEAFTALDLERYRDLLTVHAEPVATWSPETAASVQ